MCLRDWIPAAEPLCYFTEARDVLHAGYMWETVQHTRECLPTPTGLHVGRTAAPTREGESRASRTAASIPSALIWDANHADCSELARAYGV